VLAGLIGGRADPRRAPVGAGDAPAEHAPASTGVRIPRRGGTIAVLVLAGALAGLVVASVRDGPNPRPVEAAGAVALLLAGWALHRRLERTADGPLVTWAWRLALALLGWAYVACVASPDPRTSVAAFVREIGLYVPLAQMTALLAARSGPRALLVLLAGAGLAWTIAALGVAGAASLAAEPMREALEARDWIRWETKGATDGPWRVQFPFTHHNRLAFYALAAAFLVPLAAAPRARTATTGPHAHEPEHPGRRALHALAALVPVAALLLSKTRGAYLAGVGGVLASLVVRRAGRRRAALALGAVIGAALLVPDVRKQAASLVAAKTYTARHSSVVTRVPAWRAGLAMIADRPVFGIGAGWRNFRNVYRTEHRERLSDPERKPHAHNNLIELGAELGLPGLALFMALQALVLAHLVRATREDPDRTATWLGLFVAVHVYGLTNYALRLGNGALVWLVLAAMLHPRPVPLPTPAPTLAKPPSAR